MKTEYEKLIADHDKTLSSIRELWINAESETDKERAMASINIGLDHRLELMKRRDA